MFYLALNEFSVRSAAFQVSIFVYVLMVQFDGTEKAFAQKGARTGFRPNPQIYNTFKELAAKNGYTVTCAFEKFKMSAVEFELVFPSANKNEPKYSEARVMLV